ncbi:MAG: hypothetical protein J6B89_00865 [Bacilli bacterium]|nr:hypothetical protein [Bacilli bacterium]
MIGNINYNDYQNIITELTTSKDIIKILVNSYRSMQEDSTNREMDDFILTLENYIKYLNKTLKMNIDADKFIQENSN